MNHTLSDSQLEAMIKSAVNSSGPLPPDEKFSQLVSALRELQERRNAAMDSESECLPLDYLQGHKDGLEWAAQLAEANHPETGDWLYDDPIELAKAIRKGPDMPPAQSVDSEPVAWTWQHREQWHVTNDEERARDLAWDGVKVEPLYRHAQQPVVPEDVLDALQKVARIRLDLNDFDGDRRGIADCLGDAEEALIEVVNRRAAMLQELQKSAGAANNCRSNKNVQDLQDESRCGIKSAPPLDFLPKNTESRCSNSPVNDATVGKPFTILLPDISSKAFWSGAGKNETFHPETYRRWVKEAIERYCAIARIDAEVK